MIFIKEDIIDSPRDLEAKLEVSTEKTLSHAKERGPGYNVSAPNDELTALSVDHGGQVTATTVTNPHRMGLTHAHSFALLASNAKPGEG